MAKEIIMFIAAVACIALCLVGFALVIYAVMRGPRTKPSESGVQRNGFGHSFKGSAGS